MKYYNILTTDGKEVEEKLKNKYIQSLSKAKLYKKEGHEYYIRKIK